MENEIYFAPDIFGARKKTKSVLESQINLENSLWPFFWISISFFHKFYQKLLYIKTQISSNYPPFPLQLWKN